jgi:type I restriction enzyme S subunit
MSGNRLADACEIVMGQSPPGELCNTEGIGLPLLNGPTEFGPHHPSPTQFTTDARKRARPGDILFCVRGSTTGRMNWADQEYAIGRGIAAIRHKSKSELQPFVRAVIEHDLPELLAQATGSTFPNVSAEQLSNLKWPELAADEQRAIAHILGTLDDKIELNRRMSETLEAMARALFKSWFVDFDPVRAKMQRKDAKAQRCKANQQHLASWRPGAFALNPEILDLFPDRLVESELGPIPEGWEVGTLGDVAEHPRRGLKPKNIEPNTPYIALEHMPRRSIGISEWGTGDGLESDKFEFKKGEILFGKLRPYFHKVGVAPIDGVCSTDIVVVAPKDPRWFGFVLGHVSSKRFVEYTDACSTGTKMPRTSWTDMARFEVVLPPEPVAEGFTRVMSPLVERIIAAIHESRTLAALRDALLPKLISGELRVKDAERIVQRQDATAERRKESSC